MGLEIADFMDPENIVQLGYEPYRIDLLVDVSGVNFKDCFDRRVDFELDGVNVSFLSLEDLVEAKNNAGRLQDLADAEQLEKIKNKNNNN